MKCVRCGRGLLAPTKTINGRNGPMGWGPVCALKDGLIDRTRRIGRFVAQHGQSTDIDPRQMELELRYG